MSSSEYNVKCSFQQARISSHLWLSGDTCAPSELSTKELKARRKVHLQQIGEMCPSAPDYQRQLLFFHLYDAILKQRQLKIKVILRRA